MQNLINAPVGTGCYRLQMNLRRLRRLIGAVDACEVFDFSAPCLSIQSFHVTALTFRQRGVHKDFDELARIEQFANHLTLRSEWRNKGNDHNESRVDQEFRDFTDTANVFYPIGFSESQIPIEPVANVIAIQDVSVLAIRIQTLFQKIRDRG